MKDVVEVIVCSLVDDPDAVDVAEVQGRPGTVTIHVEVAPGDMGKVIGRQGRIAGAIRTVANAAAAKYDLRAVVDFGS